MKKVIATLVVGIFLFGAALAGVSNEEPISEEKSTVIEKTYEFSEPTVTETDNYVIVSMDDTKSLMQEGKPILPYTVDVMRFPLGTTLQVTVNEGATSEIQLPKKIEPYPMVSLLTTQGKLVVKEGAVYESNQAFPESFADYRITVGLYNGERVVTLSLFVYPCKYMPHTNTLAYTDKVKVIIDYELPAEQPLPATDAYDLLIIAPDDWKADLEPLKQHKESHGVATIVVGLNEIYGGTYFSATGRDDAEKIKYFIKNAIEQWGITYVMIVGGRQGGLFSERWLAPVRYTHLDDQSDWEATYLSDLYFSDIYKYEEGQPVFDDWDSNGNGVFAEWSGFKKDTLDLSPDVYVGRLACRNKMDLDLVANRIIEYENTYAKNQDWFKKMVLVGGDTFPRDDYYEGELGTSQSLEYMEGFEGVKLYTSLGTLTGVSDVVTTVSQGCGFLNFEGHGNPMNWATHPPHDEETWIDGLGVRDMKGLSNEGMYPVCVVGGCHNSQFNVSVLNALKIWEGAEWYQYLYKGETAFKCWSWRIMSTGGGGAIASIGSTGLGYGLVGDYNDDGIPDTLQGLGGWIDSEFFRIYGQEGKEVLGEVHSTAIANYVAQFPVTKDPIDCKTVEEWVLLGDPSLMIGGYE